MNPYHNLKIDLHVHSDKSDGSLSPSDLVSYAIKQGVSAFALTDHDKGTSVTVIPGIELSTAYEGKDIHIVGLFIDKEQPAFRERIGRFANARINRNLEMCKKLTEYGMPITYDELTAAFPNAVITRAHYSRLMMQKGYVKSLKEAYERYIGDYGPCFIPRKKITPEEGVRFILSANGLPVLAHPMQYGMGDARLQQLIDSLKEAGLVAMEAIYCTHTPSEEAKLCKLAKENGLLISGGSDFHGKAKPGLELGTGYGRLHVPQEVLDNLIAKKNELFPE